MKATTQQARCLSAGVAILIVGGLGLIAAPPAGGASFVVDRNDDDPSATTCTA
jgi:hypothetical protein